MVKSFELSHGFPVSSTDLLAICISNTKCEEECHSFRGNQKVTVTDWMESTIQGTYQRVCFFMLVDPGGIGESQCMETQKYWLEGETIKMKTSIVPDNPSVGNAFRIESDWVISGNQPNICELVITTEVECKKALWGVTAMVETMLSNKVRESLEKWCIAALKFVQAHLQTIRMKKTSESVSHVSRRTTGQTNRLVFGTENILHLFQENSKRREPKDKESDCEDGFERIEIEKPLILRETETSEPLGSPATTKIAPIMVFLAILLFVLVVLYFVFFGAF